MNNDNIVSSKLFFAYLTKNWKKQKFTLKGEELLIDIADQPRQELELSRTELEARIIPAHCRGDVDPAYVKRRIRANDHYFLLYYKATVVGRHGRTREEIVPAAFLLAEVTKTNSFYIDVVCAMPVYNPFFNRHSGAYLIKQAIYMAGVLNLKEVSLSALPPVLTYYPRFNFAHRKSCQVPPDIEVPEVLVQRAKARNLPSSVAKAHDDDDMLEYMTRLQELGYGSKYEGDCGLVGGKSDKKKMKEGKCGNDGFKMRLCLK